MTETDTKAMLPHQQGILSSRTADLARQVFPEPIKDVLRQVVRAERAQYPLKEPHTAALGGYRARFWIRNHSDWYRIGSKDTEGNFAQDLIRTLSSSRGAFLDIGAAQGFYSIFAAKAGSRVYAVDPDPVSLDSIGRNIGLNEDVRGRITVLPVALGNEDGDVVLFSDKDGKYAPSLKKTVAGLEDKEVVKQSKLDTLVAKGILPIPDVVKIDVEGAEGMVLDGMQATLTSESRPQHIFLEIHKSYLQLFGTDAESIFRKLKGYGYELPKDNVWPRRHEVHCHFVAAQPSQNPQA